MREFWKKTIQVLLYGGLEKEQYNPTLLLAYRIAEVFQTSVEELYCLREKALWCCQHTNKIIFMGAILLFGMLAFVNFRIRNNPFLIHVCACMFMAFYLGVGILAAIGEGSIQERTGSGNTKIK